jgi:cytochrome P450
MTPLVTPLDELDYFTDHAVLRDPYAYFSAVFSKGAVHQPQTRDVVFVTGFDEAIEVLRNTDAFSSAISVPGAAMPLPFEPKGDDISEQLDQHRAQIPGHDLIVTYDGSAHANSRSLLTKLFTPSRLKANEAFMVKFADELVTEKVRNGKCELIQEVAAPYVTLVIADLLGVPADDRDSFRKVIDAGPPAGNMDSERPHSSTILEHLGRYFYSYAQDRRANPRADVLTELATAKYPDGSTPELIEIVNLAVFLFAAGQDTSAKLLGNSLRFLVEDRGLQQRMRDDRSLIPAFIEEVLRLEGSTKATFRLAIKNTTIGGRPIAAGTRLVIALAATNRDPRRWEDPQAFKLDRPKIKEHLAFGRGAHTCIGAPLARAEVRVLLDKLMEHTSEISLSEQHHGQAGDRKLNYEPSFIIRGLEQLHLVLNPR